MECVIRKYAKDILYNKAAQSVSLKQEPSTISPDCELALRVYY